MLAIGICQRETVNHMYRKKHIYRAQSYPWFQASTEGLGMYLLWMGVGWVGEAIVQWFKKHVHKVFVTHLKKVETIFFP